MRALEGFYNVTIPNPQLANLVLSVETEELGIGAGLQDRVAQVYQGLTYMDFDRDLMEGRGYGEYRPLEPENLKNVYVAYKHELGEGSEVFHNDLRARYDAGESAVVDAMTQWAGMAEQAPETATGRKRAKSKGRAGKKQGKQGATSPPTANGRRAVFAVCFLSGFGILALEILWTRMFAQVLENSVYTFAAILVTVAGLLPVLLAGCEQTLAAFRARLGTDSVLIALREKCSDELKSLPPPLGFGPWLKERQDGPRPDQQSMCRARPP